MARIRTHVYYSDYRAQLAATKALRQGGFEDEYWAEDELVDHRRFKANHKPAKKRGCPDNDYKAHVYVWVLNERLGWNYRYSVDEKVCCGCGKIAKRKYHW